MKKIGLFCICLFISMACFAAQAQPVVATAPSVTKITRAEQKKQFKARRKLIRKLVKDYRKAPDEQKPAIKAELAKLVSQSVDAAREYVRERIAAEKANLQNWEDKLNAEEKNLDQIKAEHVEDLLSGTAKKKHKAAKKAWKKQMKSMKR